MLCVMLSEKTPNAHNIVNVQFGLNKPMEQTN